MASLHNLGNRIEISASAEPRKTYDACEWKSGHDVVEAMTRFGKKKRRKRMMTIKQLQKRLEAKG